jgi:hypothetical protein
MHTTAQQQQPQPQPHPQQHPQPANRPVQRCRHASVSSSLGGAAAQVALTRLLLPGWLERACRRSARRASLAVVWWKGWWDAQRKRKKSIGCQTAPATIASRAMRSSLFTSADITVGCVAVSSAGGAPPRLFLVFSSENLMYSQYEFATTATHRWSSEAHTGPRSRGQMLRHRGHAPEA